MIELTQREIYVMVAMALRTGLAGRFDKSVIAGGKKIMREKYYPSLTDKEIDGIEDTIDYLKGEFQKAMAMGLMYNKDKVKSGFKSLFGLHGTDDKSIDEMDKMHRDVGLGKTDIGNIVDKLNKHLKDKTDDKK